jgi:hypothetical protein
MSFARDTLTLVESAIAGQLPAGMASYQIAGRAITKIPIKELWELRDKLRAEIAAENRTAEGKGTVKNILVRFDPA